MVDRDARGIVRFFGVPPVAAEFRMPSIEASDWDALEESEACRLKHFGFDEGVVVEPLHLGPFGRDPLAIRVGRMTVAIRRSHARAVRVNIPA